MDLSGKQLDYLRKIWHLTPREVEILKLVCSGLDNGQISKKMHITYNTVRAHLGNAFRKIGVKGRTGMILRFVKVLDKAGI